MSRLRFRRAAKMLPRWLESVEPAFPREDTHIVTNAGTIELRFMDVELLRGSAKSPAAAFLDGPAHQLETENDRVRIYRIKLAPSQSLPAHRHNSAFLAVTVSGGTGPGSFEWHNDGVGNGIQAGSSALEIVELEPR